MELLINELKSKPVSDVSVNTTTDFDFNFKESFGKAINQHVDLVSLIRNIVDLFTYIGTAEFDFDCRNWLHSLLKITVELMLTDSISQDDKILQSSLGTLLEELKSKFEPRATHFAGLLARISKAQADVFEVQQDWLAAANILSKLPLDKDSNVLTREEKVDILIKLMRLCLEEEDTVRASMYINKVTAIIDPKLDVKANVQFKLCQARVLDSNCSFLLASRKYFELSCIQLVSDEERLFTLAQALICIVLAEASPQRSRFLATLYKDERCNEVNPKVIFDVFESIYTSRMIDSMTRESFTATLQPHQLARLSDGSTLLDRAVTEHNLRACAHFYSSVKLDRLATILNTPEELVERTLSNMVSEGNLAATIDQVSRFVQFYEIPGQELKAAGAEAVKDNKEEENKQDDEQVSLFKQPDSDTTGTLARQWDENIARICQEIENVVELITQRHPEFVENRATL